MISRRQIVSQTTVSDGQTDQYQDLYSGGYGKVDEGDVWYSQGRLFETGQTKAPNGNLVKKGWLLRLTRKQWSQHWFVLKNGSLTYYRGPAAELCSFLDGVLDLSLIKHIQQEEEGNKNNNYDQNIYAFSLKMWNGEHHVLAASSLMDRSQWLEAILESTSAEQDDDGISINSASNASSAKSSPTSNGPLIASAPPQHTNNNNNNSANSANGNTNSNLNGNLNGNLNSNLNGKQNISSKQQLHHTTDLSYLDNLTVTLRKIRLHNSVSDSTIIGFDTSSTATTTTATAAATSLSMPADGHQYSSATVTPPAHHYASPHYGPYSRDRKSPVAVAATTANSNNNKTATTTTTTTTTTTGIRSSPTSTAVTNNNRSLSLQLSSSSSINTSDDNISNSSSNASSVCSVGQEARSCISPPLACTRLMPVHAHAPALGNAISAVPVGSRCHGGERDIHKLPISCSKSSQFNNNNSNNSNDNNSNNNNNSSGSGKNGEQMIKLSTAIDAASDARHNDNHDKRDTDYDDNHNDDNDALHDGARDCDDDNDGQGDADERHRLVQRDDDGVAATTITSDAAIRLQQARPAVSGDHDDDDTHGGQQRVIEKTALTGDREKQQQQDDDYCVRSCVAAATALESTTAAAAEVALATATIRETSVHLYSHNNSDKLTSVRSLVGRLDTVSDQSQVKTTTTTTTTTTDRLDEQPRCQSPTINLTFTLAPAVKSIKPAIVNATACCLSSSSCSSDLHPLHNGQRRQQQQQHEACSLVLKDKKRVTFDLSSSSSSSSESSESCESSESSASCSSESSSVSSATSSSESEAESCSDDEEPDDASKHPLHHLLTDNIYNKLTGDTANDHATAPAAPVVTSDDIVNCLHDLVDLHKSDQTNTFCDDNSNTSNSIRGDQQQQTTCSPATPIDTDNNVNEQQTTTTTTTTDARLRAAISMDLSEQTKQILASLELTGPYLGLTKTAEQTAAPTNGQPTHDQKDDELDDGASDKLASSGALPKDDLLGENFEDVPTQAKGDQQEHCESDDDDDEEEHLVDHHSSKLMLVDEKEAKLMVESLEEQRQIEFYQLKDRLNRQQTVIDMLKEQLKGRPHTPQVIVVEPECATGDQQQQQQQLDDSDRKPPKSQLIIGGESSTTGEATQQLRQRLNVAETNMKSLTKQLRDSYSNYDCLEISYNMLKQGIKCSDEQHKSELNQMKLKVDDLTNKLLISGRQLTRTRNRLTRCEIKNKSYRRHHHNCVRLLNFSKDLQKKLVDLERKVNDIHQLIMVSPSSQTTQSKTQDDHTQNNVEQVDSECEDSISV